MPFISRKVSGITQRLRTNHAICTANTKVGIITVIAISLEHAVITAKLATSEFQHNSIAIGIGHAIHLERRVGRNKNGLLIRTFYFIHLSFFNRFFFSNTSTIVYRGCNQLQIAGSSVFQQIGRI